MKTRDKPRLAKQQAFKDMEESFGKSVRKNFNLLMLAFSSLPITEL